MSDANLERFMSLCRAEADTNRLDAVDIQFSGDYLFARIGTLGSASQVWRVFMLPIGRALNETQAGMVYGDNYRVPEDFMLARDVADAFGSPVAVYPTEGFLSEPLGAV